MTSSKVYRLSNPTQTTSPTNPRRLILTDEEIPTVGPHQVLVKIKSVALNYRDIAMRNCTYPFPTIPDLIPCSDCAGTVVSVGSSENDNGNGNGNDSLLRVGDAVVASFHQIEGSAARGERAKGRGGQAHGVLSEFVVFSAHEVVRVPEASAEWASVVCTGVTAWNSLFGGGRPLLPGQSVLLQGTGGVSMTALQIAKAAGLVTIITSSSDEKLALTKKKYGADYTINYKTTPDWSQEVLQATGGRGVDLVLENGGSGTIKQSINALAFDGTVALIGFLAPAAQADMPDVCALALSKGATLRGIGVGSKEMLEDCVRFFGLKNISPPVSKVFGFGYDDVCEAYGHVEAGKHVGKVCIDLY